jgi:hypothetical protein
MLGPGFPTRRAAVDATRSIAAGFSGVRAALPASQNRPAVHNDGSALTNVIVAPARPPRIGPQPSEAKHLARHEQPRLMQRPPICSARLTRSSHACRVCRCPRGICTKITARAFQRERLASYSPLGYLARSPLYNAAL